MNTTRRGFLSLAALPAVAASTGCLEGGGAGRGVAGTLVIYAVPPPQDVEGGEVVEAVPLDDPRLDVRAVRVTVQTAPVYKGRDMDEGLDATSTAIESREDFEAVREALDSTPSTEPEEPYPVGGTVIEFEDNYFLLVLEEA